MAEDLLKSVIKVEIEDLEKIEQSLNKMKKLVESSFSVKTITAFENKINGLSKSLQKVADSKPLKGFIDNIDQAQKKIDSLEKRIGKLNKLSISPSIKIPTAQATKQIDSLVKKLEKVSREKITIPVEVEQVGEVSAKASGQVKIPIVPDFSKFEKQVREFTKKAKAVVEVDLKLSSDSIGQFEKLVNNMGKAASEIKIPSLEAPVSDLSRRFEQLESGVQGVVGQVENLNKVFQQSTFDPFKPALKSSRQFVREMDNLISKGRQVLVEDPIFKDVGHAAQALRDLSYELTGLTEQSTGVAQDLRNLFAGIVKEVKEWTVYQGKLQEPRTVVTRAESMFEKVGNMLQQVEDRLSVIKQTLVSEFSAGMLTGDIDAVFSELNAKLEEAYSKYVAWGAEVEKIKDLSLTPDFSTEQFTRMIHDSNQVAFLFMQTIKKVVARIMDLQKAFEATGASARELEGAERAMLEASDEEIGSIKRDAWIVKQMFDDASIAGQESLASLAESFGNVSRPLAEMTHLVNALGKSFFNLQGSAKDLSIDLTKMTTQYTSAISGETFTLTYPEIFKRSALNANKLAKEVEKFNTQLAKSERVFGPAFARVIPGSEEEAQLKAFHDDFIRLGESTQAVGKGARELFEILTKLQGVTTFPEFVAGLGQALEVMRSMKGEVESVEEVWKTFVKASEAPIGSPLRRLYDELPQIKDMFGNFTESTFGVWKLFLSDMKGSTNSAVGSITRLIHSFFADINLESLNQELAQGFISEHHLRTLQKNLEVLGIDLNKALVVKPEAARSLDSYLGKIETLEQRLRFARKMGQPEEVITYWEEAVRRLRQYVRETEGVTEEERKLYEERLKAATELKSAEFLGAPKEVLDSLRSEVERLESVAREAEAAKEAKKRLFGSQLDLTKVAKLVDVFLAKETKSFGKTKSAVLSFSRTLRRSVSELKKSFTERMQGPGFFEELASSITGATGALNVKPLIEPYVNLFDSVSSQIDKLYEGLNRRIYTGLDKVPGARAKGRARSAAKRISGLIKGIADQVQSTSYAIPWETAFGLDKESAVVLRKTFDGLFLSLNEISKKMKSFAARGGKLDLTKPIKNLRASMSDLTFMVKEMALQGKLTPESLMGVQQVMNTLVQTVRAIEGSVGFVDAANKKIATKVKGATTSGANAYKAAQRAQKIMSARMKGVLKSMERTNATFVDMMQSTYRAILESLVAPGSEIDLSKAVESFVVPILRLGGPMRSAMMKAFSKLTVSAKQVLSTAVAQFDEELAASMADIRGRVGIAFKYPFSLLSKEIASAVQGFASSAPVSLEPLVAQISEDAQRVVPEVETVYQNFARQIGQVLTEAFKQAEMIEDESQKAAAKEQVLRVAERVQQMAREIETVISEGQPVDISKFRSQILEEMQSLAPELISTSGETFGKFRSYLNTVSVELEEDFRRISTSAASGLSPRALNASVEAFKGSVSDALDSLLVRIESGFSNIESTIGLNISEISSQLEEAQKIRQRMRTVPEEIRIIIPESEQKRALEEWRDQLRRDYLSTLEEISGFMAVSLEPYIKQISVQIPNKYAQAARRGFQQLLDVITSSAESLGRVEISPEPVVSQLQGLIKGIEETPGRPILLGKELIDDIGRLASAEVKTVAPQVFESAQEVMKQVGMGFKSVEIEPEVKSTIERIQLELSKLFEELKLPSGKSKLLSQLGLDKETARTLRTSLGGVRRSLSSLMGLWKSLASEGAVSQRALAASTVSLEDVYTSTVLALDALHKQYMKLKESMKERPTVGLIRQLSYIEDTRSKLEGVLRVLESIHKAFEGFPQVSRTLTTSLGEIADLLPRTSAAARRVLPPEIFEQIEGPLHQAGQLLAEFNKEGVDLAEVFKSDSGALERFGKTVDSVVVGLGEGLRVLSSTEGMGKPVEGLVAHLQSLLNIFTKVKTELPKSFAPVTPESFREIFNISAQISSVEPELVSSLVSVLEDAAQKSFRTFKKTALEIGYMYPEVIVEALDSGSVKLQKRLSRLGASNAKTFAKVIQKNLRQLTKGLSLGDEWYRRFYRAKQGPSELLEVMEHLFKDSVVDLDSFTQKVSVDMPSVGLAFDKARASVTQFYKALATKGKTPTFKELFSSILRLQKAMSQISSYAQYYKGETSLAGLLHRMLPEQAPEEIGAFAERLDTKTQLISRKIQFLINALKKIKKGGPAAKEGAKQLKSGLSSLESELVDYNELFTKLVQMFEERGTELSLAEAQFLEHVAKPLNLGESMAKMLSLGAEQLSKPKKRIKGLIDSLAKETEQAITSSTAGLEEVVSERLKALGEHFAASGEQMSSEVAEVLTNDLVNLFKAYGTKVPDAFLKAIKGMAPEMRSTLLKVLKEATGGFDVSEIIKGTTAIYGRSVPAEQVKKLASVFEELNNMLKVDREQLLETSGVLDHLGITSEQVSQAIQAVVAGTKKQATELEETSQMYNRVANAINGLVRAFAKLATLSSEGLGGVFRLERLAAVEESAKEYKKLISEFYTTDEKTLIAHRVGLLEQLQQSYQDIGASLGRVSSVVEQGFGVADQVLRGFTRDLETQAEVFETVTGMYNRFAGSVNSLVGALSKLAVLSSEGLGGVTKLEQLSTINQIAREYKRLTSEYVSSGEKEIIRERIKLLESLRESYAETVGMFGKSLSSVESGLRSVTKLVGEAVKSVLGTQEQLGRTIGVEEAIGRFYKLADAVNKFSEASAKAAAVKEDPVKVFSESAKKAGISESELTQRVVDAAEKLSEQMAVISKKAKAVTGLGAATKEAVSGEQRFAREAEKAAKASEQVVEGTKSAEQALIDVGKSFETGGEAARKLASEIEGISEGFPQLEGLFDFSESDFLSGLGDLEKETSSAFSAIQEITSNFALSMKELIGSIRPAHLEFLTEEDWARMLPVEYIHRAQDAILEFEGDLSKVTELVSTLGERFGIEPIIDVSGAEDLVDYLDLVVEKIDEASKLDFSRRFSEGFSKVTVAASETLRQAELLFEVIQQIAKAPREETPSWMRRAVAAEIYNTKAAIDSMLVELRKLGEGAGVDELIEKLEVLRKNLSKSEGAVVSLFDRMTGVIRNAKDSFVNLIAYQTRWFVSTMVFWSAFEGVQDLIFSLGNFEQQVRRVARVTRDAAGNIMGVPSALKAVTRAGSESADAMERMAQSFSRTIISQSLISAMQQLGVTSEDAAEAMYQLGSAGLDLNEQIAAIIPTLQLVIGTEGDMREVTKLVAGIYNVYGDTMLRGASISEKFAHISDVLATVFRDHQVEINELVSGYQYSISSAQLAGLTFEQLSAILGVLNDKMIKGSKAGRSFNEVIAHLAKNPAKFAAALNAVLEAKRGLNLEDLFPKGLEGQSVFDILIKTGKELQKSFDNTELSIESLGKVLEAAGIVGGRSLAALLLHANEVEESFDRIQFSSSYAAKYLSEEFTQSIQWSFKRIRGYLQGLVSYYINFFGNFFRSFTGMISKTSQAFSSLGFSNVFQQDTARLAALVMIIETIGRVMFGRRGVIPGFRELSEAVHRVISLPVNVFVAQVEKLADVFARLTPTGLIRGFRRLAASLAEIAPSVKSWESAIIALEERWASLESRLTSKGLFSVLSESFKLSLETMAHTAAVFSFKVLGYLKLPGARDAVAKLTKMWLDFTNSLRDMSAFEALGRFAKVTFVSIGTYMKLAFSPKYFKDFVSAAKSAISEIASSFSAFSRKFSLSGLISARLRHLESPALGGTISLGGGELEFSQITAQTRAVERLKESWIAFDRAVKESRFSFRTLAAAGKVFVSELIASFTTLKAKALFTFKSIATVGLRSFKALVGGVTSLAADIVVSLGLGAVISKLTDWWSQISEGSAKAFRDAARSTQDFFATFSQRASRSAQVGHEYVSAVHAISDALASVDLKTGQIENIEKLRRSVEVLTHVTGLTELKHMLDDISGTEPSLDVEKFKDQIRTMAQFVGGLRQQMLKTFSPDSDVMHSFNESIDRSIEAIDRIAPHLTHAFGPEARKATGSFALDVKRSMVTLKLVRQEIEHLSVATAKSTDQINHYFANLQIRYIAENMRKQIETLISGMSPLFDQAQAHATEVARAYHDFLKNANVETTNSLLQSFSFLDAQSQFILQNVAANIERLVSKLVEVGGSSSQVISTLMSAGLSKESAEALAKRWKSLTAEQRRLALVAAILSDKFAEQKDAANKAAKGASNLTAQISELNSATMKAVLSSTDFIKNLSGMSGSAVDAVAALSKVTTVLEGFSGVTGLFAGVDEKAQAKALESLSSSLEQLGKNAIGMAQKYATMMGVDKKLTGDLVNLIATKGVSSTSQLKAAFESVFGEVLPASLHRVLDLMKSLSEVPVKDLPRLLTEITRKGLSSGKAIADFLQTRYPNAPADALRKISTEWKHLTGAAKEGLLTQVLVSEKLGSVSFDSLQQGILNFQNFVVQSQLATDAVKQFSTSVADLFSLTQKSSEFGALMESLVVNDQVVESWEKFEVNLRDSTSALTQTLPAFREYSDSVSTVLSKLKENFESLPKSVQDSYWDLVKSLKDSTSSMVSSLSNAYKELSSKEKKYLEQAQKFADAAKEIHDRFANLGGEVVSQIGSELAKIYVNLGKLSQLNTNLASAVAGGDANKVIEARKKILDLLEGVQKDASSQILDYLKKMDEEEVRGERAKLEAKIKAHEDYIKELEKKHTRFAQYEIEDEAKKIAELKSQIDALDSSTFSGSKVKEFLDFIEEASEKGSLSMEDIIKEFDKLIPYEGDAADKARKFLKVLKESYEKYKEASGEAEEAAKKAEEEARKKAEEIENRKKQILAAMKELIEKVKELISLLKENLVLKVKDNLDEVKNRIDALARSKKELESGLAPPSTPVPGTTTEGILPGPSRPLTKEEYESINEYIDKAREEELRSASDTYRQLQEQEKQFQENLRRQRIENVRQTIESVTSNINARAILGLPSDEEVSSVWQSIEGISSEHAEALRTFLSGGVLGEEQKNLLSQVIGTRDQLTGLFESIKAGFSESLSPEQMEGLRQRLQNFLTGVEQMEPVLLKLGWDDASLATFEGEISQLAGSLPQKVTPALQSQFSQIANQLAQGTIDASEALISNFFEQPGLARSFIQYVEKMAEQVPEKFNVPLGELKSAFNDVFEQPYEIKVDSSQLEKAASAAKDLAYAIYSGEASPEKFIEKFREFPGVVESVFKQVAKLYHQLASPEAAKRGIVELSKLYEDAFGKPLKLELDTRDAKEQLGEVKQAVDGVSDTLKEGVPVRVDAGEAKQQLDEVKQKAEGAKHAMAQPTPVDVDTTPVDAKLDHVHQKAVETKKVLAEPTPVNVDTSAAEQQLAQIEAQKQQIEASPFINPPPETGVGGEVATESTATESITTTPTTTPTMPTELNEGTVMNLSGLAAQVQSLVDSIIVKLREGSSAIDEFKSKLESELAAQQGIMPGTEGGQMPYGEQGGFQDISQSFNSLTESLSNIVLQSLDQFSQALSQKLSGEQLLGVFDSFSQCVSERMANLGQQLSNQLMSSITEAFSGENFAMSFEGVLQSLEGQLANLIQQLQTQFSQIFCQLFDSEQLSMMFQGFFQSFGNSMSAEFEHLGEALSQQLSQLFSTERADQISKSFSNAFASGFLSSFGHTADQIPRILGRALNAKALTQQFISLFRSVFTSLPFAKWAATSANSFVKAFAGVLKSQSKVFLSAMQSALQLNALGSYISNTLGKMFNSLAPALAATFTKSFGQKLNEGFVSLFEQLKKKIEGTSITVNVDTSRVERAFDAIKTAYSQMVEAFSRPIFVYVDVSEAVRAMMALKYAADAAYRSIMRARAAAARSSGGGEESSSEGHSLGGLVSGYQVGGRIPGYGGGDRHMIAVEGGEYVIRKEAVKALGTTFFNSINKITPDLSRAAQLLTGSLKGFQSGGEVSRYGAHLSQSIVRNTALNKWFNVMGYHGAWRFIHPNSPLMTAVSQAERRRTHRSQSSARSAPASGGSKGFHDFRLSSPMETFDIIQGIFKRAIENSRLPSPMETFDMVQGIFKRAAKNSQPPSPMETFDMIQGIFKRAIENSRLPSPMETFDMVQGIFKRAIKNSQPPSPMETFDMVQGIFKRAIENSRLPSPMETFDMVQGIFKRAIENSRLPSPMETFDMVQGIFKRAIENSLSPKGVMRLEAEFLNKREQSPFHVSTTPSLPRPSTPVLPKPGYQEGGPVLLGRRVPGQTSEMVLRLQVADVEAPVKVTDKASQDAMQLLQERIDQLRLLGGE